MLPEGGKPIIMVVQQGKPNRYKLDLSTCRPQYSIRNTNLQILFVH